VELFLGCYEFIEHALRRVVEATRTTCKMLGEFITTFIAMIPKEDNTKSFEELGQYPYAMEFTKLSQKSLLEDLKGYYQNKFLESSLGSYKERNS
jgi:hypothetical protein